MKPIRVSAVVIVMCSFLSYGKAAYLDLTIPDSQHTWLGWYDAGLNTLPNQQGWTVINSPADTQPTVQNGLLLSQTTVLQYLYWSRTDQYICYPDNHALVLEFQLKIKSSPYVTISSSRWRTGYIAQASDYLGRTYRIGIADAGLILSNDYDWTSEASSSFVPFTTTDGFHVYRFVIQNNTGQLYVDGNPVVAIGVGSTQETPANRILFGDATYHSAHDAEMTYFRYGVTQKTGDIDGNGSVDMTDLQAIVSSWLNDDCGCMSCCEGADIDHSGKVDLKDVAILSLGWLGSWE